MTPREKPETTPVSEERGVGPLSRRDFLATTAATGIAVGVGQPAAALAAQPPQSPAGNVPSQSESPLPSKAAPVDVYEGTAAGAVLAQLKAAGVRMLFHTNTSGFVPFWEAIHQAGDVQVINFTHEGQAVAAAAGYAMASRTLGVFFGADVGVPNAVSNLYCAWKDRQPLLAVFLGGVVEEQGKDGFESWDDMLGPTRPFTVWTASLSAEDTTDVLRRAIKNAFGPPTGPVTLTWGAPNAGGHTVKAPIYRIDQTQARHRTRAHPELIQTAARWLAEAEHPIFVAGPEVTEDGARDDLQQLADKLAVAVTETQDDLYDNFPTDHPLFLGRLEPMRYPRQADLLISFGEYFRRRGNPLRGTPTVQISHDPDILGGPVAVDLAILSDVRSAVRDISDALDSLLTKDRIARIRARRFTEVSAFSAKLKQARELALRARFDSSPIVWERVGYELERALDRDAVIVPELGTQDYKVLRQLTFGRTNKRKIGRTFGSALGWGVGAALGVNLALPDRQIVSLQGDGGFLFGQAETLWSVARYESPMLIVIMNNRSYNETRNRNLNNSRLFLEQGMDYNGYLGSPDVDFVKIAEAFGLKGEKVSTPADLAPALGRALRNMREGKAVVLDVNAATDGPTLSRGSWYQRLSIAEIRRKKLNA
jgi:thiamine pyrophosphate-dependent acetolactate synthase large subunit-like protein